MLRYNNQVRSSKLIKGSKVQVGRSWHRPETKVVVAIDMDPSHRFSLPEKGPQSSDAICRTLELTAAS